MSNSKNEGIILITMDVEPDLAKYLKNSYEGMKIIPRFVDLLDKHGIKCDFFVTSNIAQKFGELTREIIRRGHSIGCHGSDHSVEYYCLKKSQWQFDEIKKSSEIIEKAAGRKVNMFRAPNFSANGDTIQVLEKLGYKIDSSVLPGRLAMKWKVFPIYDFTNAPAEPYNPSKENIAENGESPVIELPLTENPDSPGAPVGVGYLNLCGVEKTMKLIDRIKHPYVTFLLHPWELVDIGKNHPNLPACWKKGCRDSFEELEALFKRMKEKYMFSSLMGVSNTFSIAREKK